MFVLKLAMIGPYPAGVKQTLVENLPCDFEVISVASTEEYDNLRDADFILLRTLKINAQQIASLEKCQLIQRWGAGHDSVDIEAAGKKGIAVAVMAGANAVAVAELTLALMLAVYRNIPALDRMVKQGQWQPQSFLETSYMLKGKTVGLLGCGSIGKLVAKRVQAFDANVVYYDPYRLPAEEEAKLNLQYMPQEELFAKADVLSLHLPALAETEGMINAQVFAKMKPTAVLINTARGTLVNEADLEKALKAGQIAAAGLDSFAKEPIDPTHPLLQFENLVLSPHVGGNTCDLAGEMVMRVLDNIGRMLNGQALEKADFVNAEHLKK